MSTKTIAVDSRVYERLAAARREGESFSKAIDRLLQEAAAFHTGGAILGKSRFRSRKPKRSLRSSRRIEPTRKGTIAICVDTTFPIDLWREKDLPDSAARALLVAHSSEDFAVPAHAAGEFHGGGAALSPDRLGDSLQFLRLFRAGEVSLETALDSA